MASVPSFAYVGPRRRNKWIGALLWLLSRPGYVMVWALFTASDIGERLNAHLGDWSWRDVVGSLIVFPIAIALFFATGVGFWQLGMAFGLLRP